MVIYYTSNSRISRVRFPVRSLLINKCKDTLIYYKKLLIPNSYVLYLVKLSSQKKMRPYMDMFFEGM